MAQPRYAVEYGRVSKEDQAKKGLSIPAQFRRMEDWATRNDVIIVHRDADEGFSSFHDNEHREGFWRAVEVACNDKRVTLFLVDDPMRFFRDSYEAGEVKARLRRHGVRVLVTSNPYDTRTIHGVWQEKIDEARSQTGSMEIAFNTIRAMEQNAQTRDSETGWCYKNGGRPPFGYTRRRVVRGQDDRERDLYKALWEIDTPAAQVLRFFYLDCRLGREMSFWAIRDELNRRGMLAPTPGRPWTISSITEMMREDRILQYAGTYFWNKEDHQTPGRRFKDKAQWIRVENAHPAIITPEEAEAVIALNKTRTRENAAPKTVSSPYGLTGKNALGEDMFICAACRSRMSGYQRGKGSNRSYACSSAHYRGECRLRPINRDWLEGYLLEEILTRFGTAKKAAAVAARINEAAKSEDNELAGAHRKLDRELQAVENKMRNLTRAVADGYDVSVAKPELDALKTQREQVLIAMRTLQDEEKAAPRPTTAEEILVAVQDLKTALAGEDPVSKRKHLRAFVRRLEYDPHEDSLQIHLFAEPSAEVRTLCGARDRT